MRRPARTGRPNSPAAEATTLTIIMLLGLGLAVTVLAVAAIAGLTPTGILIGAVLLAGGGLTLLFGIRFLAYRLRQGATP